ncbi:MAG TPA: SAM-dependent methyltransferase [Pirellulales bacterium]|nr:SAM-dependent methyltransferase [Pirellulales bacterium]
MKSNQASRTAEYMALFRALESGRAPQDRLFDDPFACEFLSPNLRRVVSAARLPVFGSWIPWLIDGRWPGARTSAVARTRFIDDRLIAALDEGMSQVVILGAGFDCRAYRLPQLSRTRVFEVDHPATQRAKRACLGRCFDALPGHVRFVAVDFNSQGLDVRLAEEGVSADTPTFWIWEGVTNYLSGEAVSATLDSMRTSAPRSRLVFTYVHRGALDGVAEFPGKAALQKTLAQAGEVWTFGLDPAELPEYLASRGFHLLEDVGSVDYRALYLPAVPRLLRGYEFYRIAVAETRSA